LSVLGECVRVFGGGGGGRIMGRGRESRGGGEYWTKALHCATHLRAVHDDTLIKGTVLSGEYRSITSHVLYLIPYVRTYTSKLLVEK